MAPAIVWLKQINHYSKAKLTDKMLWFLAIFFFAIYRDLIWNKNNISFCILQGVKGAPYYVGASQTLPRGMYSDRNKNIIGKLKM